MLLSLRRPGSFTRRALNVARVSFLLAAFLIAARSALAMPASPHPVLEQQPGGAVIELYLRGDEHRSWLEDRGRFAVVRDRGRYVYATPDAAGRFAPTQLEVGRHDPRAAGLRPGLRPAPDPASSGPSAGPSATPSGDAPLAPAPIGTVRNLVVLMRFANHATRPVPSTSQIDVMMNADGGDPVLAPTGSVRDAHLEYSYGQLTLASTVTRWVDLPQTESYYAAGASGLTTRIHEAIRAALDALESDPSFRFRDFDGDHDGQIDAITFLHSGYGAEWGSSDASGTYYTSRIWSHKWTLFGGWIGSEGVRVSDYNISPALWGRSGSAIGRIGVICHELGHFFGLPDLYDTDSSGGEGIGSYGLMANSWGFDGSQLYPPHPSPWSRIRLGWVSATPIAPGLHELRAAELDPGVFRIDAGFPEDEYLLLENRQPRGLDGDMPQGGLAIWHIDERAGDDDEGYPGQAGWPQNGAHYRVALLQADGRHDLERGSNRGDAGDLFHAAGVREIGPHTTPNTHAYQYGDVYETGIRIFEIGASGDTMSFRVSMPDADGDGIADAFDNCLLVANPDQRDTNADGFGNPCDADYDDDGAVATLDFAMLSQAFGATTGSPGWSPHFDADGDGLVGNREFRLVRSNFGAEPGPSGLECAGAAPCRAP
jgi:M6 family metalloprotease-like protein